VRTNDDDARPGVGKTRGARRRARRRDDDARVAGGISNRDERTTTGRTISARWFAATARAEASAGAVAVVFYDGVSESDVGHDAVRVVEKHAERDGEHDELDG
jgi:hypothetical protein